MAAPWSERLFFVWVAKGEMVKFIYGVENIHWFALCKPTFNNFDQCSRCARISHLIKTIVFPCRHILIVCSKATINIE